MWFVYILKCIDTSLYTGSTNNLEKRFNDHLAGKGAAYTRSHKPVEIVYSEELPDRSTALKREIEIKKLTRTQKEKLIES